MDAVSLLDLEPELAEGVPEAERALLRRHTVVPEIRLRPGPWEPPEPEALGERPFGLLVADGLLTRSIALAERSATQLLGPGDVVTPWSAPEGMLPVGIAWHINAPSRLAVLDERVLSAARRWPEIFRFVHERLACQTSRLAVHTAIAQLPRVDVRILALLWQLADRFGRVTRDGVVVPLHLTHEALGRLIGAQRPTVTLALRDLTERDAIGRTEDGGWILREGSDLDLAPKAPASGLPGVAVLDTRLTAEHRHYREERGARVTR